MALFVYFQEEYPSTTSVLPRQEARLGGSYYKYLIKAQRAVTATGITLFVDI